MLLNNCLTGWAAVSAELLLCPAEAGQQNVDEKFGIPQFESGRGNRNGLFCATSACKFSPKQYSVLTANAPRLRGGVHQT
jgi:hypothetical protein